MAVQALEKLNPGLQRWIKEQGWGGLRPIQEAALDPVLNGESCVIEAPTAGGKTEAVLFPTLTRAALEPQDSVQVLYIAPLRALLNNLEMRGEDYARCCGLHAFKWHGDVSQDRKVESLRAPPNLLLTTPESIEAILLRKPAWRKFFRALDTVVIDEAHNFAGGDRGGHLLSLLARLEAGIGRPLQRIAVSATIGNPDAMCQWLSGVHQPARRIQVSGNAGQRNDFLVHHFDDRGETEATPTAERAYMRLLSTLTTELKGKRSITFVRSRSRAEDIAKALQQFTHDRIRVRTHHSNVSKFFREEAESLIQQAGEQGIEAIISTSTLELGIDIGELDRIVQMSGLSSPSAFLQRVGRTGRRPGKPRHFRGLTQDEDDLLLLTATVTLGIEHRSESLRLRQRAFHLLAHQILCLSLQNHGIAADEDWSLLAGTYAFSKIEKAEYDRLLRHMLAEDFLREADGVLVIGEAAEKRYLSGNWRKLFAVFSTAPLYDVMEGRTQVGTLDSSFVEGLELPFYFTLAGKLWKALSVDFDGHLLKAARASEGIVPKWQSFGGPDVPLETAQRVGELVNGYCPLPGFLDEAAQSVMAAQCQEIPGKGGWSPQSIQVRRTDSGKVVIVTYAGDTLNRTLAKLLEARGRKVVGNYAEVVVSEKAAEAGEPERQVWATLERLGTEGSKQGFAEALHGAQKAWPFSPFQPMLPDDLTRAALVDETTDLSGLCEFLKVRL